MKALHNYLLILLIPVFFASCEKGRVDVSDTDYLIFGWFYGFCEGETCVETFQLTESKLYEDLNDDYSYSSPFKFVLLSNDKFEEVKDLMDLFPNQLLNEPEGTIGCPDCYDQGGIFIEHSENGVVKRWRFDNNLNSVPVYLHDFLDEVKERILLVS